MRTNSKFNIQNSKLIDGVIIKTLIRNHDERGFFEEIIRKSDAFFAEGFGQLSHSYMKKGIIKAWHIHKTQIDWWFVARGTLHVALCDLRKKSPTFNKINELVLGENGISGVLKIPAGVAHGCKTVSADSELFYVTSGMYDTNEEGRIDYKDPGIRYNWTSNPPSLLK